MPNQIFPFGSSPSEEDIFHFLDKKLLPELIDMRLAKLIMCKALGDQDGNVSETRSDGELTEK